MTCEDLYRLPLSDVQRLYSAYCIIIDAIEYAAGGPYNVGANGEYWSAVKRRNMCRQVYNERFAKEVPSGHGE